MYATVVGHVAGISHSFNCLRTISRRLKISRD